MNLGRSSFEIKTRLWASLSCAVLAATVFGLSACGALSSKERDETPSALMLKAQTAYDTGKYSEAITHLKKVIEKDPSNEEARVRLAFSLNASIGVTPMNLLKSLTGGGTTGGSDLSKLTNGAGLAQSKTDAIKALKESGKLNNIEDLRKLDEFRVFQEAFLTLCQLFSQATLNDLRTRSPSAVALMEVDKCNQGLATSNANVSIAALTLAIDQFATLFNSVLDANKDGKIDVQVDAEQASSSLSSLNNQDPAAALTALNAATQKLASVANTLKGDLFKLATAQFSIISSVIRGSNLPSSVADPLNKAVGALENSLNTINGYLDAGKNTSAASTTGGQSAVQAASKANTEAQRLLTRPGSTPQEKTDTCKNVYCLRTSYGLPTDAANMPAECATVTYEKTCTQ